MKKNVYLWLSALLVLVTAFQAKAQDEENEEYKVTITWNIPGSIILHEGGISKTSVIPAGATSYVAQVENSWDATYIEKASGYVFDSVTVGGDVLSPMYNGMYKVDMDKYNGMTVVVTMAELTNDATFSLNVINGRDNLTVTMWGTGREIKVQTGEQSIPYNSTYETGVNIEAPVNGAVDPVLTQNGIAMEWKAYNGWDSVLYHKDADSGNNGFPFSNGTNFTVKYCDTPDEGAVEEATVTLNYSGYGEQALTMLFNVTKNKSITKAGSFTVDKGDVVRLVFNGSDYDVAIDGTVISHSEETYKYEFTVNDDITLAISATERDYGTTTVTFAAAEIDGLVLREGSINGNIIEHSELVKGSTSEYTYLDVNKVSETVCVTTYTATISLKSPKIFITADDGYWIACSEYKDGDKIPSGVATPDYTLYVVDKKIILDTKVVVYLAVDGANATASSVIFRDRNRETKTLQAGYNEFMFDAKYSSPLSVLSMGLDESVSFSVYKNMAGISKDEDSGAYNVALDGDAAIHIFAGRPAAASYNVSVYVTPDVSGAEVVADRVNRIDSGSNMKVFKNCEVAVTTGGNPLYIDGNAVDTAGAEPYVFAPTAATSVVVGDVAKMNVSPSDYEEIAEFTNMVVSFPNATVATVNADLVSDICLYDVAMVKYGCQSFSVNEVSGAAVPTFRISCLDYPAPSKSATYKMIIPEGLFTLNGSFVNEDADIYFTLKKTTTTDDITVNYGIEDSVSIDDFNGLNILFGDEVGDYSMTATDLVDEVIVRWNNEVWEKDVNYVVETYQNSIYVKVLNKSSLVVGEGVTFGVYFPQGAYMVDGAESPEVDHTIMVLPAKVFVPVLTLADSSLDIDNVEKPADLKEFLVSFPTATKASVVIESGISLKKTPDYSYFQTATIEPVEGAEVPTFKVTFAEAPTAEGLYVLEIFRGTFLLDDCYSSSEVEKEFGDFTTSVDTLLQGDDAAVTVYGINGQVILRNGTAADLKSLAKGLYIVNGKKFIKK